MPNVNNISEYKFALLILHKTENIFEKQKKHKIKEWSMLNG